MRYRCPVSRTAVCVSWTSRLVEQRTSAPPCVGIGEVTERRSSWGCGTATLIEHWQNANMERIKSQKSMRMTETERNLFFCRMLFKISPRRLIAFFTRPPRARQEGGKGEMHLHKRTETGVAVGYIRRRSLSGRRAYQNYLINSSQAGEKYVIISILKSEEIALDGGYRNG